MICKMKNNWSHKEYINNRHQNNLKILLETILKGSLLLNEKL